MLHKNINCKEYNSSLLFKVYTHTQRETKTRAHTHTHTHTHTRGGGERDCICMCIWKPDSKADHPKPEI